MEIYRFTINKSKNIVNMFFSLRQNLKKSSFKKYYFCDDQETIL